MATICPQYELGLTIADRVLLPWMGLPYPMAHTFNPYSLVRTCSNGVGKGFGFPIATWSWSVLNHTHIYQVLSLYPNDADASVWAYVATYKDTGWDAEIGYFHVLMHRPVDGQDKTIIPGTRNQYSNVVLKFTRLVEE